MSKAFYQKELASYRPTGSGRLGDYLSHWVPLRSTTTTSTTINHNTNTMGHQQDHRQNQERWHLFQHQPIPSRGVNCDRDGSDVAESMHSEPTRRPTQSRSRRRRRSFQLRNMASLSSSPLQALLLLHLLLMLLSDIVTFPTDDGTITAAATGVHAFEITTTISGSNDRKMYNGRIKRNMPGHFRTILLRPTTTISSSSNKQPSASSITQLSAYPSLFIATTAVTEAAVDQFVLADYAPAATSLFNNMKLPAAVVTAGMISLGFATGFPDLPRETAINKDFFPPYIRKRCEALRRLHIVVALIAVTSELIVVLFAAVEVNQLTERHYAPAYSVWDLIQRDCDLAWSAVNSHFILGIIGFVTMLALRAYVMLLSAQASNTLMTAASTGTTAALCLMISIVNRGVESGGGNQVDRYGNTILDLFQHYAMLLAQAATNEASPGPLQLSAIVLETISLLCMLNVLLFQNGKKEMELDSAEIVEEAEECPVIDIASVYTTGNGNSTTFTLLVDGINGNDELSEKEREKLARCLVIETKEQQQQHEQEEEDEDRRRREDFDNSSVSVL